MKNKKNALWALLLMFLMPSVAGAQVAAFEEWAKNPSGELVEQEFAVAALDKVGRNRFICLPQERRLLWRSAEKCLRTPVLKRIRYTGNVSNPVTAGYSALSELSDLAPENERIFAMAQSEFRTL